MNDNKVTLLSFFFFIVCAGLIGGVYFLNGQLTQMHEEYTELEQRRGELSQTMQSLMQQKKVFSDAFVSLENYKVNVADSDMIFYSEVQGAVQDTSGVNILSTQQRGTSPDGRSSLALTLRGDYYSFTQVLANWRNLLTTVRVSAMTVTASRTSETRGEVQVDVTVQAIVGKK
ncbi:MAG: hypothetical protein LBQ42_12075 [Synergistaceae bacterium]|jgi:hypothetical protein|nr:hypothetical protein [Synergistaceae bacterium]